MTARGAIYPDLEGKSVIVTGGAQGIGASIVRGFARQKSKVGFIDIAEGPSEKLTRELGGDANFVHHAIADIRDIPALKAAIELLTERHGQADVLVNNAGHDERHATETVTPEVFDERIAVNLRHTFFAAQAVLPGMKIKGGGAIINFSSISWMAGMGGMAVYTAAKSAMLGLTRFARARLRPLQHPGERHSSRLGTDRAPGAKVADARGRHEAVAGAVPEAVARTRGRRAICPIPGLGGGRSRNCTALRCRFGLGMNRADPAMAFDHMCPANAFDRSRPRA